jgi:hypothetical protein
LDERYVDDGLHSGGVRTLRARGAAACKRSRDAHAILGKPSTDRCAHIARRDNRY